LKFPIGKFKAPVLIDENIRTGFIKDIEDLPDNIEKLTEILNDEQLNTPYRPGGWTLRQVVHHLADSHINSYVRYRLALTEDEPTIKTYDEKTWAELHDAKNEDIHFSLVLLKGLHSRWTKLLRNMSDKDFQKKLIHPDYSEKINLNVMTAMYSWHCRHHTAHIADLVARKYL